MPGVVRLGDKSQGHGCFPPRQNTMASSTVFADNKGVHRLGDGWQVHICGKHSHDGKLSSASSDVFADNKGVGRIGDSISCGDKASTGSSTVIID